MNAAAFILAVHLAHRESLSALPDAPVVPDREERPRAAVRHARAGTARVLRRAADRVDAPLPCA